MFCRIVAHTAPATIRYEDADIVAFDAEPAATALHVLVVPRRHIRSVAELADTELAGRLVLVPSRIAAEPGPRAFALPPTPALRFRMFSTSTGTSWPTAPWGIRRG